MFKEIIISILLIIISIICSLLIDNSLISCILLSSGLLNIWLATINKSYNYIFGAIFYLLNAYISYVNGLFGISFMSFFVYFPLQIDGFIRWKNDNLIKSLSNKISIIMIISIITTSIGLSLLLNKIPNQSLEILDATSNITNICGIILMNLKYREAWFLWLINNIIDMIIWVINTILHKSNSMIMLIVSLGYLLMNIYGILKWKKSQ